MLLLKLHRASVTRKHCFQFKVLFRTNAGKFLKIVNEVRFIIIAVFISDLCKRSFLQSFVEQGIKSRNPQKKLWTKAGKFLESSFKLSY